MKKIVSSQIKNNCTKIIDLKSSKGEALFFLSDSETEVGCGLIQRGFCLSESSRTISLSIWFKPCIHFSSIRYGIFEIFSMKIGDEVKEARFIKGQYSDKYFIDSVCAIIEDNTLFVQEICSDKDIINAALSDRDEWLSSGFNKADLALLCYINGKNDISMALLKEALEEIHHYNPVYDDIHDFYLLISSGDSLAAEKFLMRLKDSVSIHHN